MTTIYTAGDKVSIAHPKYPGVWIVRSVGPANAVLEPATGGRGMRVPHTLLIAPADAAAPTAPTAYYSPGEFVRITDGRYTGLWVVIADKGGDKVNLAKPGGDNGRYLRGLRQGLTRVDIKDVLKEGVAL
jgi:hypothetical protein